MSCGTVCKMAPAIGGQLVLMVGVAVAEVELDVVARVVRFVVREGGQASAGERRGACAVCRHGRSGRGAGSGGGGACSVCPAGRCAKCRSRLEGRLCCLSAWPWRKWSWTWWRGWCGLSCGTACKMPLASGVQILLLVGLAVAGLVQFVPSDGVRGLSCARRAAG